MASCDMTNENKSNLFIYGDSFSDDWFSAKSFIASKKEQGYYARLFEKNNKKEPIHFSDILESKLNINKKYNFAAGGACNYTILESLTKTIHLIQPNDFVFFQWSDISRYRTVESGKWYVHHIGDKDARQSIERVSEITVKEIENWTHLLKTVLPENTFIWTPFLNLPVYTINQKSISIIKEETNGDIPDNHWGNEGHKQAGNVLYKAFINQNSLV